MPKQGPLTSTTTAIDGGGGAFAWDILDPVADGAFATTAAGNDASNLQTVYLTLPGPGPTPGAVDLMGGIPVALSDGANTFTLGGAANDVEGSGAITGSMVNDGTSFGMSIVCGNLTSSDSLYVLFPGFTLPVASRVTGVVVRLSLAHVVATGRTTVSAAGTSLEVYYRESGVAGPQSFTVFASAPDSGGDIAWVNPGKALAADDDPATATGVGSSNLTLAACVVVGGVVGFTPLPQTAFAPTGDYAYVTRGTADVVPADISSGADVKAAGAGASCYAVDDTTQTEDLVCTDGDFASVPDAANLDGFVAEFRTKMVGDVVSADHVRLTVYYVAPPTVDSVTPASGPAVGGTAVTIAGEGFVEFGIDPVAVTFGGVPATDVVVVSVMEITCTAPAHDPGTVDVVVSNGDDQTGTLAAGFTYTVPTLTSVTPSWGLPAGGTSVTLIGTRFLAGAGVTFGGDAATNVTVVSATTITCDTPAHAAGPVDVVVTNTDTQTATLAGYSFRGFSPGNMALLGVG